MLSIYIPERVQPATEFFDEKTYEFVSVPEKLIHKECTLHLEHSLVSLHRWEQKWCVPFSDPRREKTIEESVDYIRCMTLDRNVNPLVYDSITSDMLKQINEYIDAPMTASWIRETPGSRGTKRIMTAERLYYLMIAYHIPVEFEKWHLNSLIMLLRVCEQENAPKEKMSQKEYAAWQVAENERRKAKYKTKG